MNQLLYGCQREHCDTPTCYTCRKQLSRGTNASRRLTLLSARIIACSLAAHDDPLKALCPGKPAVPALSPEKGAVHAKDSHFREEMTDGANDEEKENRQADRSRKKSKRGQSSRSKDVGIVTDKGLKDSKSFMQQLFNTSAMRMVEWISLPLPTRRFENALPSSLESPLEHSKTNSSGGDGILSSPPKIKFPSNSMEVMDTGRLNRDSEPVSQIRHQEILQQPPRKRGLPLKDITPTPHSNVKAKLNTPVGTFTMGPTPPPINPVHRPSIAPQVTPSRGDKNTPNTWEPVEEVLPSPQTLKMLDLDICTALVNMCSNNQASPSDRKDAQEFARQSIFYVFSTPEAVLASFGGIGDREDVAFNSDLLFEAFELLYKHGWEELVKLSMWTGVAKVFSKPGKGISDVDAAGMIVLSLHVLASGLVKDDEVFRLATEMRAAGTVTSKSGVVPDIGLDNEIAERLMKRVLRAMSFRSSRAKDNTVSFIKRYLQRSEESFRMKRRLQLTEEIGLNIVGNVSDDRLKGTYGLARSTLEWTRTVFVRNWDGYEIIQRNTLAGACIEMMDLLYTEHKSYNLLPTIFETRVIGERINPSIWAVDWAYSITSSQSSENIHLLDHHYLLPVRHRVTFLRAINIDTMKKAYETAITNIRMAGQMNELTKVGYPFLASKIDTALSIYMVLTVRRSNLLDDALNQLIHREHRELLRPLKVRFDEGEEGVDQGGVQQEFFGLLMQEVLKSDYGIFTTDERTRLSWFWESTLESMQKFELVGLVVGLAVYNGITLPVNFPRVLYIKLLGGTPTLDDIDDFWPDLARGLKELLQWGDGDVGNVFIRTYEYSYSVYGQVRSINMLDAKDSGPEFINQPIPSIKKPKPVRELPPQKPLGRLNDWLPYSAPEEEGWLGSLNDVLEGFAREEEREQERQRRLESGERGYTISYRDLNLVDGASEPEEVGRISDVDDDVFICEEDEQRRDKRSAEEAQLSEIDPQLSSTSGSSYRHEEFLPDKTESEKSWQTMGDDDLLPISARIRLPSDDGEDWDDSTHYSPSNSARGSTSPAVRTALTAPDLLPPPIMIDTKDIENKEYTDTKISRSTSLPVIPLPKYLADMSSPGPSDVADLPGNQHTPSMNGTSEQDEFEEAPLVTNANRHQFVEDYMSWLTDRSIRRQFEAFQRGFFAVTSKRSLQLFDAASLQDLIEGQSEAEIDINKLESVCKYEDGYHAHHHVIKDFWAVARGYNDTQRRMLLEFVTSSPRVPIGGLDNIMFYIVRNGEDCERLPSSLTCFGRLLLPEYSSKKKMRQKLSLALENAKGFGNP
jgi:hypothetical protein